MLNVACFVQSCLTDADFVIFSNYCLSAHARSGVFTFLKRFTGRVSIYLVTIDSPGQISISNRVFTAALQRKLSS